mmetsp:Transcript_94580/g.181662  ORF Transcript_94580/g.181662 Transcript_94580/m.181662 type:complete len:150 (-) Transcript_94580:187-636(-)
MGCTNSSAANVAEQHHFNASGHEDISQQMDEMLAQLSVPSGEGCNDTSTGESSDAAHTSSADNVEPSPEAADIAKTDVLPPYQDVAPSDSVEQEVELPLQDTEELRQHAKRTLLEATASGALDAVLAKMKMPKPVADGDMDTDCSRAGC